MEELIRNYREQDNVFTAPNIYIEVQERHCVGVMADGFSPSCKYGDGETNQVFCSPGHDIYGYESLDELLAENPDVSEDEIEEHSIGYIWVPIQFFLARKGALDYIERDKHNHGELRIYVNRFSDRNVEMNKLINFLTKKKGN